MISSKLGFRIARKMEFFTLLATCLSFISITEGRSVHDRNCRELYLHQNKRRSGTYEIDVDGDGPLQPISVYCQMGDERDSHQVLTVVHHDAEDATDVRGFEAPGSYVRNITYGSASEAHLMALIDLSFSCQQYIKWSCKGARFSFWYPPGIDSWWVGRHWKPQHYWGGAETDSRSCGCHPYCTPTQRNSTCNCDTNDKSQWLEDSGLLLDSSRLPVLQLRFGDTGEATEAGQYTLGPLICRAVGHKDQFMGSFKTPVTLISPGYERGEYPPPFHRYTWSVKIKEGDTMELVFPEYDVVHYGSYNVVPECRSVVTVRAEEDSAGETVVIMRQKSPPYYASEGSQTTVNITLTTCNQDENVPLGRGFKAEIRITECGGCNPGLGQNGGTTLCTGVCGIIASEEYPFPHSYYFSSEVANYTHTWILRVLSHHVVELEFRDFDIPANPGARNCTPERGVLIVYSGEGANKRKLIGSYCNLNRRGVIYSKTNIMTLVFQTRWRKVSNGRGFYGVYRGVYDTPIKDSDSMRDIPNVAKGKPARQSSTLENKDAICAVDGNRYRDSDAKSCAVTKVERDPWWQVNLQKRYLIYGFEIHSAKTDTQVKSASRQPTWPSGQYGLPMPISGCPSSKGFSWQSGQRYHDMVYDIVEDAKVQHWSPGILLKGGLQKRTLGGISQKNGVIQHFCMKLHDSGNPTYSWEPGEYCIYQYGRCPTGFRSGYITWLDRQNIHSENTGRGFLPTGNYTASTTTIYFCCRDDGSSDNSIKLPNDRPFYLFMLGKSCQKVEGMTAIEHYFHYNEDVPRTIPNQKVKSIRGRSKYKYPHPRIDLDTEKGISISYCYYDVLQTLRGFRVMVDETGLVSTLNRYYDDLSHGIPHTQISNFQNAYSCYIHLITAPEFSILRVNCSQPIYGQYVTLQIFDRYDSLQLCEMKVFAIEECGKPLGMASEEIFDMQIKATSSEDIDHFYHTNGRLNAKNGWCASLDDKQKELTVDLLNLTTVTGVVLQGLNSAKKSVYVKKFHLLFSNDSISWTFEEEPVGQQKVYICDQCESEEFTNDISVRFNFLRGVIARFVLVKVLEYREAPCLRLELIGCGDRGTCGHAMTTPSGFITSPNYPYYYGQDKSCWWTIKPDPGKHIELNFVIYDLAEEEDKHMSGVCHDELTVYASYGKSNIIKSPDGKHFPKRIVSYDLMSIHLKSCFRYSFSRYRGFYAVYKTVDCPGCGIGDYQCPDQHLCDLGDQGCGKIFSINYPLPYENNYQCRWLIKVNPPMFIKLTFLELDVAGGENCLKDYVEVYDGESSERDSLIGRFCNAERPPIEIVSSWYSLLIVFSTDSEITARGFSLKYVSQSFQVPLKNYDFDDKDTHTGCLPDWKQYNGYCYNAFHELDALQWYEAEAKCKAIGGDQDGHLVSILNKKENAIVHYLLTNFWNAQHRSLYIGLNDEAKEGVYRWSDGNPMIYTDWAPAGRTLRTQPDGGAYQDCTMLRVDSGHSTAQWHDIPCSLGKLAFHNWDDIYWPHDNTTQLRGGEREILYSINSYICKMRADRPKGPNELLTPIPALVEATGTTPTDVIAEKYFLCRNREIISTLFVCDGAEDCRDGSDEETCPLGSCPESSFRCGNGRCISVAAYCDYKVDCGDQLDESRCDYRECETGEFQCRNGQCIPLHQRCDLLPNCNDKSDEYDCGGACNPNSTFQCYDGTCIPSYTLCDGHRDCPGKYHEDEQFGCYKRVDLIGKEEEKKLCSNRARKTCRDLYVLDNIKTNGYYYIDPDGMDGPISPFRVFCQMGATAKNVITIVHHESEYPIHVTSVKDGAGSYVRTPVYELTMDKIKALTNVSGRCRQFISWVCTGTGFHFDSKTPSTWWVSWNDEPQYSWGGATENGTCACYPKCKNPKKLCNCDSVGRFEQNKDEGYLEGKEKLPIKEVHIGYTFKTGQSGIHYIGPLECSDGDVPDVECKNTTNYMRCHTGHYVPITFRCLYEFDQYGYHRGCRDVTHMRNCETFTCPKDHVKCPESYCIPTTYVCDGKWDCIAGGDEEECDFYNCPGQYKCYNRSSCLPLRLLCDGMRNCPHGDDELLCDLLCPEGCICVGLYISCMRQNASVLHEHLPKEVRKLDFSFNRIDLQKADFSPYITLGELILQYNHLTVLPPKRFLELRNLYKLDLSNNRLSYISASAFEGLKNLRMLYLESNPMLAEIEPEAFNGLSNLPALNLSRISLKVLRKNTFNGMSRLRTLNLSNNMIKKIENGAFVGLHSVTMLDIQGNDITDFSANIFTGLKSLDYLYSDSYTFCCMASPPVPDGNCSPPADEISSCEDLMSSPIQRSFLWVLGMIALVGNLFVIVWRIKTKDSSRISSTLILSLGFADLLMGVYLIIIASVDVYYRGRYIENSDNWRKSTLCKISGFLSTVSSEASILTLLFITFDRLICLCFPLSQKRFTLQITYKLIFFSWLTAATMAALPLMIEPYFKGRFYARSGVCLAIHITNHRPAGWEYSVAIFFCINLVAFLAIVSAYAYMYTVIRRSYHNMNRLMARHSRENKIGRQMALIVLTNSLCWFPIIVMGLMAMTGVKITGEAYAWTAIFVLPLNSATNPLIYTISSLRIYSAMLSRFGLNKESRGSRGRSLTASNPNRGSSKRRRDQLNSRPFRPPPGYISLLQYLKTVPNLRARHLLKLAMAICKVLKELHESSYALGGIDVNAVFVCEKNAGDIESLQIYVPDFNAYKITNSPISGVPDDTALDMEEYGLLVKKMLRVYHVVTRSNDPMQGTAC